MGFDGKNGGIRLPEIAETETPAIGLRNPLPESPAGAFAVVANHEGDQLSSAAAHDRPQPALPGTFAHKGPDLIEFQAVIWLRGVERGAQRRQRQEFFVIQAARVFRETPKMRLIPRILGRS